ncbi:poly E-rich protein [Helicobacter pylori]|uniref:Poly E-rich protein n=1 Tax=Helicobacter pylori TaxID=210 RepID=A0A377RMT2_HELPX|nr:chemotaxis regulatory protein ChePep [Helicobacter pylori]STR19255.1 poly E-rich protein [Helicobacter pylori]
MKMILFNQNPMITKLLESVSKKLELPMENFNHYQELSARLKEDPEWILIADDECLEKLDQIDWLELKETISQNKNSVCMYKKGNEAQPFLEGFEMKIKKPFLPTEVLKILQKKLGSNINELEPSQNLDPTQEILETNWDELENLGDLEALAKEEPNNEEQLLPTLNAQEEKEEVKKEEKEEVKKEEKEEIKETPQEEEKPKDDEKQEGETLKDKEVSKELETQEKLEIPKEETQEEVKEEIKEEVQEEVKEETQEIKEEKQEETQDSPSAQELEAMQELVKEIQENSNGQEDKEETQENAEIPQDKEIQEVVTEKTQVQELEIPKEKTQESAEALQETQAHELEKQEIAETPQEKEKQEIAETPQDVEVPQSQEKETQESAETPQEETQETQEKETPQTQDEKPQEDHYESIEDIPEPVMAKAMGEELPFLNENDTETPKENDTETPKESVIKTPQEKEESAKTSKESNEIPSPLELRLNLQDLLKSLNQESLKSLLENKTLSIKITLEDKKPNA